MHVCVKAQNANARGRLNTTAKTAAEADTEKPTGVRGRRILVEKVILQTTAEYFPLRNSAASSECTAFVQRGVRFSYMLFLFKKSFDISRIHYKVYTAAYLRIHHLAPSSIYLDKQFLLFAFCGPKEENFRLR